MSDASITVTRNPRRILDDKLLTLGDDQDVALVLRSSALAADTALSGVLVGTPVTPALAANPLILANVTASGDILLATNRGGNSEAAIFVDGSAGAVFITPVAGGLTIGLAADAPAPDNAQVHIWKSSAGAVTAHANAQLVVESAGETGIQILSANNANAVINFGDDGSAWVGRFYYNHNDDRFQWNVAGGFRAYLDTDTLQFQQASRIETSTGALALAPAGDLDLAPSGAANGQALNMRIATGTKTTDSGTGTETIPNAIPAGSIVLGVTARVTTILAGSGLTTWSLGLSGDTDRWGTGLALAGNTTVDATDFATDVQPTVYPAATDIVLTAAAGQFDSGVIRYTIHYYALTAPTS